MAKKSKTQKAKAAAARAQRKAAKLNAQQNLAHVSELLLIVPGAECFSAGGMDDEPSWIIARLFFQVFQCLYGCFVEWYCPSAFVSLWRILHD